MSLFVEMMNHMQRIFIENAKSLGQLTSKCAEFHNRCIPKKVRSYIDRGISACNHRDRRNDLQQKQKIGRDEAEKIIEEESMKDLDVWQTCVPAKPTSARTCRAITRQITSQLRVANLESEGLRTHIHT